MLLANDGSSIPKNYHSALAQIKTLGKRLEEDCGLRIKYTETRKMELDKRYVILVESHNPQLQFTPE